MLFLYFLELKWKTKLMDKKKDELPSFDKLPVFIRLQRNIKRIYKKMSSDSSNDSAAPRMLTQTALLNIGAAVQEYNIRFQKSLPVPIYILIGMQSAGKTRLLSTFARRKLGGAEKA